MKILQVKILVSNDSEVLECKINDFLVKNKLLKGDILDIKFHSNDYKRALIIYEVNYEDK